MGLSDLVTCGLGLKDETSAFDVKNQLASIFNYDKEKTVQALAHWINTKSIPLKDVGLSLDELKTMAPYLHYVDCRDLELDDPENCISSCSNAYHLFINSNKIKALNHLPLQLETFDCCKSYNLLAIDLSKNLKLQKLNLSESGINAIDLSNNVELKELDLIGCSITAFDVSKNLQLKKVICNKCRYLTSLGESLSNTLELLECKNCPCLVQLPQVSATTTVYSTNSPCGDLTSFRVSQKQIEENPLQVLLRLGEYLLQNRPMPNIIYLDPVTNQPSKGIDVGGLRRQLIATLFEMLFKKGSGFSFMIETLGDTLPVLTDFTGVNSVNALRTFARVMALSATSSLLMGTNLDPTFFFGIFSLSDNDLNTPFNDDIKKKIYLGCQGRQDITTFNEDDKVEMEERMPVINAIAIVANELKIVLGARFGKWRQNPLEFIEKVQGIPIKAENFKANIVCDNVNYKKWIDEFIDNLDKEPLIVINKDGTNQVYGLNQFLMPLTGSYSLGAEKIKVQVYPTRKYVKSDVLIHSCFGSIELPGDLTQESLQKELKAYLLLSKVFNAA